MKRLLIAATVGAVCASSAQADPSFHPSGANLTYGVNSVSQSAITSNNNPAAGALALQQSNDTRFRMGIFAIGIGFEFGDVNNFVDDLDLLIDKSDSLTIAEAEELATAVDPSTVGVLGELNEVVPGLGENGYVETTVAGHLLTPLLIASDALGGAVSFDINAGSNIRAAFLDDVINYDQGATPYNPADLTSLADDSLSAQQSRIYAKGGGVAEFALGYSRSVMVSDAGALYAGVKAKYMAASLAQTSSLVEGADDVDTVVEDMDEYAKDTSNITADIGVLWVSKNYQVGATLMNVTSPSFEYGTSGAAVNCALYTSPAQQERCDETIGDDEYTLDASVRLEGALHSESRNWLITAAFDTSETETPSGGLQQWAVISGAYAPESWIIPAVRLGMRKNMAGSELSYGTFGLSLFKGLTLDLAVALESTEVDGDELPRGFMANLGFEMRF